MLSRWRRWFRWRWGLHMADSRLLPSGGWMCGGATYHGFRCMPWLRCFWLLRNWLGRQHWWICVDAHIALAPGRPSWPRLRQVQPLRRVGCKVTVLPSMLSPLLLQLGQAGSIWVIRVCPQPGPHGKARHITWLVVVYCRPCRHGSEALPRSFGGVQVHRCTPPNNTGWHPRPLSHPHRHTRQPMQHPTWHDPAGQAVAH